MSAVELQRIKSCFYRILSGNTELLYDLVNTLNRNIIRRLYLVCLVKELLRNESAVPDLYSSFSAIIVNSLRNLLKLLSVMLIIKSKIDCCVTL